MVVWAVKILFEWYARKLQICYLFKKNINDIISVQCSGDSLSALMGTLILMYMGITASLLCYLLLIKCVFSWSLSQRLINGSCPLKTTETNGSSTPIPFKTIDVDGQGTKKFNVEDNLIWAPCQAWHALGSSDLRLGRPQWLKIVQNLSITTIVYPSRAAKYLCRLPKSNVCSKKKEWVQKTFWFFF